MWVRILKNSKKFDFGRYANILYGTYMTYKTYIINTISQLLSILIQNNHIIYGQKIKNTLYYLLNFNNEDVLIKIDERI